MTPAYNDRAAASEPLATSGILSTHFAGLQVLSKLLPIVIAQLKSPHDLTRKKVRTTIAARPEPVGEHRMIHKVHPGAGNAVSCEQASPWP